MLACHKRLVTIMILSASIFPVLFPAEHYFLKSINTLYSKRWEAEGFTRTMDLVMFDLGKLTVHCLDKQSERPQIGNFRSMSMINLTAPSWQQ